MWFVAFSRSWRQWWWCLWHFCSFLGQQWASVAFWACGGAILVGLWWRTSVRSAQICMFLVFPAFFMFFRGGSNMVAFCAKVDGTWQALSQRRLRYRFFLPPFSSLSPFSPFFLSFFSHFSLFPSLFSPFFQYFSFTSSHFLRFPALFGQSDASPCNPFVSNVPHEAQDNETDATCCERGFCLFLYFLTHSKKKGLFRRKAKKWKGFLIFTLLGPCRSFRWKSDVYEMRKNFHVIGTLQKRGSHVGEKCCFSDGKRTFLKRRFRQNLTVMNPSDRPSSRNRSGGCSPSDHPKCQEHLTLPSLLVSSPSLSFPFHFFPLFMNP